jgi:hypothetical protein
VLCNVIHQSALGLDLAVDGPSLPAGLGFRCLVMCVVSVLLVRCGECIDVCWGFWSGCCGQPPGEGSPKGEDVGVVEGGELAHHAPLMGLGNAASDVKGHGFEV